MEHNIKTRRALGEANVTDKRIAELIKANGPCYVYDGDQIMADADRLRGAFPGFDLLFSVKSNPFLPVVRTLAQRGVGADAASKCEVEIAREAGMPAADIFYSAPGKTDADIASALFHCTIIADSLTELARIARIAASQGHSVRAGVRVNPAFTMDAASGAASKFGVDEEQLHALPELEGAHPNLRVCGIHVHVRSQQLDTDKLCRYYENCYALAERVAGLLGHGLDFINFGGGVGIVFDPERERPLVLEQLKRTAEAIGKRNRGGLRARLLLESGRYLTCRAGVYCTRVVDVKTSRGKRYAIVTNGLNGFLRPVITEMLKAIAPDALERMYEPLYTEERASVLRILPAADAGAPWVPGPVQVCGNLCTAVDVLAADVPAKRVCVGDIVVLNNAGSYAYSLSPLLFSGHPQPMQVILFADGTVVDAR